MAYGDFICAVDLSGCLFRVDTYATCFYKIGCTNYYDCDDGFGGTYLIDNYLYGGQCIATEYGCDSIGNYCIQISANGSYVYCEYNYVVYNYGTLVNYCDIYLYIRSDQFRSQCISTYSCGFFSGPSLPTYQCINYVYNDNDIINIYNDLYNNYKCRFTYYYIYAFNDFCFQSCMLSLTGEAIIDNISCIDLCIPELCTTLTNGFLYCFTDNTCASIYCCLDYNFCEIGNFEFVSNGEGSYKIKNTLLYPTKNVIIDWDFSKRTKNKYFNCAINSSGENIFICLNKLENSFYEVNTTDNSTVFLYEAYNNCSITFNQIQKSLIYFRNIGVCNLNLCLTKTGEYLEFDKLTTLNCYNFKNITLKPKDSIFLTLNASLDGSQYYATTFFPYGFFYEFKNVETVNPYGVYPSCCFINQDNSCIKLYAYNNIYSGISCFCQTGYFLCYKKFASMGENLIVDTNVDLEISFSKRVCDSPDLDITYTIENKNYCSIFENNFIKNNLIINCISLFDSNANEIVLTSLDSHCLNINSDKCIKIIYDIDIYNCCISSLYYMDCYSGNPNYDLCIITNDKFNITKVFSKDCILNNNGILSLEDNVNSKVCINLIQNSSIKDLKNSIVNRNNLFLPDTCQFNYNYNFYLKNYHDIDKSLSGSWINENDQLYCTSGFVNCSFIIDSSSDIFNCNFTGLYEININIDESRKNTNLILNKNNSHISEDFCLFSPIIKKCFNFCGLDFCYNYFDCLVYQNNFYKINDSNIDMTFEVTGKCITFNFPINAINVDKININTQYEIFNNINYINANMSYSGLLLSCDTIENSNNKILKIPILRCCDLSCFEYPSLSLSIFNNKIIQKNINFSINIFNKFIDNNDYCLNNFLLFMSSYLNNGIASQLSTEDLCCNYSYNSSNYNFLMMDLRNEFIDNNFIIPSGQWLSFDERISFSDVTNCLLIPYKNITGNGYNYIVPINNLLSYCDSYYTGIENVTIQCDISGNLNFINTGFSYIGSSIQEIELTGSNGEITGYCSLYNSGSVFYNNNNNFFINLNPYDLTGLIKCRTINICKDYVFSGVQPISIESNYKLLDIKYPILCQNLNPYIVDNNFSSGIYYYIYDVNNFKQSSIKLVSPEMTLINYICWNDENNLKEIVYNNYNPLIGQIQNNSAQINFQLKNMIYNNSYIFDQNNICNIYLYIQGDL